MWDCCHSVSVGEGGEKEGNAVAYIFLSEHAGEKMNVFCY